MSRCGARRSVYAVAEVVRPVWGGSVRVLAVGHDGLHRDRAGEGGRCGLGDALLLAGAVARHELPPP